MNQCVDEPITKMRNKKVKKCKKYLHSRKDVVMLCGDKNDVIHCYQAGILRGSLNYFEYNRFYLINSAVYKVVQRSP